MVVFLETNDPLLAMFPYREMARKFPAKGSSKTPAKRVFGWQPEASEQPCGKGLDSVASLDFPHVNP